MVWDNINNSAVRPTIPRCHPETLPRDTSVVKRLERWPDVAYIPSEGRITKSAEDPVSFTNLGS
jgi:hypothetical protein